MNKNKNIKILIKSFFVLGLVAMSFQSLAVWQAPTGAPGTTNVAPPINAGSALQFKPGTLVVNGLQINTLLKLVDGTQGANKVLTSDANGNASWAAPATSSAVTGISIASTNGFTGTSSGGNTPTLTLNTSILSSLLKTNATGGLVPAVVGTDYYNPSSFNLTGPVTSVGLATSITDSAITASKIATGAVTATKINAVAGNGVLTNSNGTLTWAPASGGVTSVFGRTGVVVAVSGDYTVAQVTGAAPLASPVFTGNPTAPTPTAGDSDTSIATTAFVNSAISASGGGTVTGTGSQNYVTKWNSTGTGIVDSHIIDLAAGYVGIGTTTPQYLLEVGGMGFFGKSTGGAAGSIRFSDNDASAPNTITISTPAGSNLTTSYSLILPVDDGTANQILKTNGNGGLSWTDDQTGGVTSVFGRTGVVVAVSGDYTVAQVTGAAPLASPVFTGNPTAPTPTAGDSDTSIATTAFVNSAISASGNGAVWGSITGTLSAQADLQTALNAKQNLLTNSAGLLAALSDETGTGLSVFSASPAFTGNPTAPTPTAGDSDTSIATTAFVNSAISASGGGTVTGTGSQNYVTKWNSTGTGIVDSHIIDLAAGYVGIGTTTPQYLLEVGGMGFFGKSTGGAAGSIRFSDNDASAPNTITISTPAGSNLTTSYSLILPVDDGTANQILKTNGNGGLSWTDDQTGGVTSVFGRTGVVVAVSGDYTVAQVTGAAPLASPVFTGNPTAPTPTAGDSDTSIATTAFVNSAISASGGGDMYLANAQTVTGAKTFNSGKFILAGSGSGNTILNASATASGTLILPAATDTLVGKATTDVFTNKTYDTAGTGNIFKIAGTQISAISGNTNKVGTVSGTLTSGNCLKSDANGNIVDNGAVCGGGGGGDMILNAVQTVTGAKTFNSGKFILAGTSGTTILNASATASGTLILPAANDTLVGKATTDTLTNKTFSGNTNTLGGVTMNLSGDTTGDMYYRNSSGVLTRIAPGAQDTVLKMGASSVPAWGAAGGGGGTSISALTVASVPNTIDNANLTQTWQWNSLTGTGLALASSSNTTTGVNKIFEISRTGTTNSIYYSYGSYVTNTLANSGTGPNVGGYFSATGASSGKNYALTTNGGYVGIGVTAPTSRFQVGLSSTIGVGTVSVLAGSLNTVNGSGTDFLNTFNVQEITLTVGSTTRTIAIYS
jgi:hypothetical protein